MPYPFSVHGVASRVGLLCTAKGLRKQKESGEEKWLKLRGKQKETRSEVKNKGHAGLIETCNWGKSWGMFWALVVLGHAFLIGLGRAGIEAGGVCGQ